MTKRGRYHTFGKAMLPTRETFERSGGEISISWYDEEGKFQREAFTSHAGALVKAGQIWEAWGSSAGMQIMTQAASQAAG